MKKIVILGSTGSIGRNALDVIAKHPDRFEVLGLVAGSNISILQKQITQFKPRFVVLKEKGACTELQALLPSQGTHISFGEEEMIRMATHPDADLILSAIVGAQGLRPTFEALKAGKTVALANKESLVAAGPLIKKILDENKGDAQLLPVDSEHSAIHQALHGRLSDVSRIILTASGGPFRLKSLKELEQVTTDEALNHPNWSMGAKITIDSATLMNKGLEIIEAHWLFHLPLEKIAVKIHPQSIVHSLVEYIDGSVVAQMGLPDMRTPIAYALAYPERITTPVPSLDLVRSSPLTFEEPDLARFPAIKLAREALKTGESYPCVLNAANEIAVQAFLKKELSFLNIPAVVEKVLDCHKEVSFNRLEDVLEVDAWAREKAREYLC